LNRVEKVRKQKTIKDQDELETKKEEINHKLVLAEKRRQEKLEQIIDIAQKSAEKRKPSGENLAASAEETQ
jgi:hypothetical protein